MNVPLTGIFADTPETCCNSAGLQQIFKTAALNMTGAAFESQLQGHVTVSAVSSLEEGKNNQPSRNKDWNITK